MAAGEGRTEVLDSEDEPMTSSPVKVSDGADDKLCTTATVALQDTQDAPQEAARTHQAPAETSAKSPSHRAGGLDVDQQNASINDIAPGVETNVQCEREQAPFKEEAINDAATSVSPEASPQTDVDVADVPSPPPAAEEAEQVTVDGPDDTNKPSIHVTHSTSEGASHCHKAETDQNLVPDAAPIAPGPDPAASLVNEARTEENALAGVEEKQTATQFADDVHHEDLMDVEYGEIKPSSSSTPPRHRSSLEPPLLAESAARDGSSPVKDLTKTDDRQIEDCDSMTQETEGSTSHSQAPSSMDDSIAKQSAVPAQDPDHVSHRSNEDVDVEMINGSNDEEGTTASNTKSTINADESVAPAVGIHTDLTECATSPASIPTAGKDFASQVGNDVLTSESGPQLGTRETDANPPEIIEGANAVTGVVVTPQSTANNPTEDKPNSQRISTLNKQDPQTIPPDAGQGENVESSAITKTPQEITLDELKAQKASLLASLATLPAIRVLMEEHASSNSEIAEVDDEPTESDIMAAANKIVKDHIKLLHEYNELKDVGQGLMGLIADQRGIRIVEVQEEFGVDTND